MSIDLAAIVARFARLLVPGWAVTSEWCSADKMPIKGALAACAPTPTRSLAHIYVLTPWPEGEDIVSTIAHEVTHACLSPLAALLPQGGASVMLEEQAVENIGKALAASSPGVARAMARAIEAYAPQLRARIPAPCGRAVKGRTMDPKIVAAAIAAIKSGDGDGALGMLEKMLVAAAGGTPAPAADEAPPAGKAPAPSGAPADKPAEGAPADEKKPEPPAARLTVTTDLTMAARIQVLEANEAARVLSAERAQLFAARPDFAPEVKAMLDRAPIETLRDAVKTLPRGAMRARVEVAGERPPTRGDGQGDGETGRLPPEERRALDEQMGLRARGSQIRNEGNRQYLGVMTPDEAREFRARKAAPTTTITAPDAAAKEQTK